MNYIFVDLYVSEVFEAVRGNVTDCIRTAHCTYV